MVAPIRVLVADDSALSAKAIQLVVDREPGWSIAGYAHDVESALSQCKRLSPDVITMDLDLPGGGVLNALASLREDCRVPVVVVSASIYSGSPATSLALMHGADACFAKAKVLSEPDRFISTLKTAVEVSHGDKDRDGHLAA